VDQPGKRLNKFTPYDDIFLEKDPILLFWVMDGKCRGKKKGIPMGYPKGLSSFQLILWTRKGEAFAVGASISTILAANASPQRFNSVHMESVLLVILTGTSCYKRGKSLFIVAL
jgi:hypothetical protein